MGTCLKTSGLCSGAIPLVEIFQCVRLAPATYDFGMSKANAPMPVLCNLSELWQHTQRLMLVDDEGDRDFLTCLVVHPA
jgi:hypothetical protein